MTNLWRKFTFNANDTADSAHTSTVTKSLAVPRLTRLRTASADIVELPTFASPLTTLFERTAAVAAISVQLAAFVSIVSSRHGTVLVIKAP
jgi:hypothetical protein